MVQLNKSKALWEIYNTSIAIEKCGASLALTDAVIQAGKALTVTEQEIDRLNNEITELKKWVADLQSGMYISCVYCGHRYGPNVMECRKCGGSGCVLSDESSLDVGSVYDRCSDCMPEDVKETLAAHIESCPKHPVSQYKINSKRWEFIRQFLSTDSDYDSNDNLHSWIYVNESDLDRYTCQKGMSFTVEELIDRAIEKK